MNLQRIFEESGEKLPFENTMQAESVESLSGSPVVGDIFVKGIISNNAGVVTVDYTVNYVLSSECDRCLEKVTQKRTFNSSVVAVRELNQEENDDFLVLPDAVLDVDAMVCEDIIFDIPSKILCDENCKGLRPVCGVNRNISECNCLSKVVDPRLQALADLLKE